MSPYIKITGRTFTMWLLASLINGLLCAIYLSMINHTYLQVASDIIFIFFVSLFFSVPGFFTLWIILLILISKYIVERALFRAALRAGMILSAATALCAFKMLSSEFYYYPVVPALCINMSAITSILLHFKHFKKIKLKI